MSNTGRRQAAMETAIRWHHVTQSQPRQAPQPPPSLVVNLTQPGAPIVLVAPHLRCPVPAAPAPTPSASIEAASVWDDHEARLPDEIERKAYFGYLLEWNTEKIGASVPAVVNSRGDLG